MAAETRSDEQAYSQCSYVVVIYQELQLVDTGEPVQLFTDSKCTSTKTQSTNLPADKSLISDLLRLHDLQLNNMLALGFVHDKFNIADPLTKMQGCTEQLDKLIKAMARNEIVIPMDCKAEHYSAFVLQIVGYRTFVGALP